MKDQILKIIEAEGLTPAKFADEIGVQRSSISHIISGRNKPSYDFIIKIVERFRGINAEWLLTGKGAMIKSASTAVIEDKTLFESDIKNKNYEDKLSELSTTEKNHEAERPDFTGTAQEKDHKSSDMQRRSHNEVTNVNKDIFILVFYDDGSYKRYNPRD